jgi:integrase/recombinase XerD
VIREMTRLVRKHHLSYHQTKHVIENVRRRIGLGAPTHRSRTVERLDRAEVRRLVDRAYRDGSRRGLVIKTLFLIGGGSASSSTSSSWTCTWTAIRPRSI